jgi:hypothetical protein
MLDTGVTCAREDQLVSHAGTVQYRCRAQAMLDTGTMCAREDQLVSHAGTVQYRCRPGYAGHGGHVCQGGSAGEPCRYSTDSTVQYSTVPMIQYSKVHRVQFVQYSTSSTVQFTATVHTVQYSSLLQYIQYSSVHCYSTYSTVQFTATVQYVKYSMYSTLRTVQYVQYNSDITVQYNTVSTLQKGTQIYSSDQNSTSRWSTVQLHSVGRGPREVGFMSDRQLSSPSLVVLGSLGHVCLPDRDCITKDAVCRQSGICPAPIFIRKRE